MNYFYYNQAKLYEIAADLRSDTPQIALFHPNDYKSEFALLQAPKKRCALVFCQKSTQDDFKPGTISLSRHIRQQLDLQQIYEHKSVTIQPILDHNEERDWLEEFIKPYFEKYKFPYPVHTENVLTMSKTTNNKKETIEFMVYNIDNNKEGFTLIQENTVTIVEGFFSKQEYEKIRNRTGFADLGGVEDAIKEIKNAVENPLVNPDLFEHFGVSPPRGILLYGPSGTGKTTLAKAVADEAGVYIHVINGPDIIGKHAGEAEANLRQAFEVCQKMAPSVLFIDEIDAIAPKREKAPGEMEKRIVSTLLASMDGTESRDRVVVLAATNRINTIDPALRRFGRFDKEIEIKVPNEAARLNILQIKTKRMTNKLADDIDLNDIAARTHGFVGADLAELVATAGQKCVMRVSDAISAADISKREEIKQAGKILKKDFETTMEKMTPSALRENFVETPKVSWEEIGGLEEVKKIIQEMIQFPVKFAATYEKFGMSPSRGALLYGPPGCGKTLIAKATASMCGANFISVKGPELMNMYFGESEANVRELFDRARGAAPCILFFDEIDSIAPKRGSSDSGGATDRIINQLLTELDGIGHKKSVFIIGATNRPDCMDSAILRPGRLDKMIYIPLPDTVGRLQILRSILGVDPQTGAKIKDNLEDNVDLQFLAERTNGFSGADLNEICSRVMQCAISEAIETNQEVTRLTRAHFEKAMKGVRRSVKNEDIQMFELMSEKYSTNDGEEVFKFPVAYNPSSKENGVSADDDGW